MVQFSRLVAEKWSISEPVAAAVCASFEQGDWAYYTAEYNPAVAAEVSLETVWEIFDFLSDVRALAPKKKRLTNALQKAGTLTDALQLRVEASVDPFELDDMLIVYRPNPRSRAQVALHTGVGPLADTVLAQQAGGEPIEELAKAYVGTHASLKTVEDVLRSVSDIVAERFAYDETARAMAREFCFEDGFFTVTPKDRKDAQWAQFRDREIHVQDLPQEDAVKLLWAEEQKLVRVKLGVQLFRITEVLRQHFVEDPEAPGFEVICQAIDDCWTRLLQSIAERDIKDRIRHEVHVWALKSVAASLPQSAPGIESQTMVAVGADAHGRMVCTALNGEGRMLGATRDQSAMESGVPADRLAKFLLRYRPARVIVVRADTDVSVEEVARTTLDRESSSAELNAIDMPSSGIENAAWLKEKCADLDDDMRAVYGAALSWLKPLNLVAEIGTRYFDVHSLQKYLPQDKLDSVVGRTSTERVLRRGVAVRDVPDSPLLQYAPLTAEVAAAIRARDIQHPLADKGELLGVDGVTEQVYRNIAGFVVLPSSSHPLDATLVHPYLYGQLEDVAHELKVSAEGLVVNPGVLGAYTCDDFVWQLYIRRNLPAQLEAGQRVAQSRTVPRRRFRLEELEEGMVVQGKVTNLSAFGAFVNINAVCDGLVHISQLADTYVESPQQVVSVGDTVHVRVVKVDTKKRRISLSMKGLGQRTPRVKPTANHISTLIDHFSNR